MTAPPPADFASPEDVAGRWRALTSAEQETATLHLGDVSAILRSAIPGIDARIADDPNLARTALRIVVDAVVRVMTNPDGAKRVQESIGDRAYTLDYGDGRVSGLFLTDDELAPLQPSGGNGGAAIGTAIVQTRPGWAPYDPASTWGPGWWPTG